MRIARILFGFGMMSVGVLTLVLGYGVLLFGPVPDAWIPLLKPIGYASGILMVGTGAGLVFDRSARVATYILFPFLMIWTLTRVPVPIADPGREISWFAVGEIAALAAAAMVLFTGLANLSVGSSLQRVTQAYGLRTARLLFGSSVVTFGLSHFFEFAVRTVSLVPAWLPFRAEWAYLVGAAQVAAGLGVLFSIYPRLAAAAEATMMSAFTLLVWVPAVIANPKLHSNWGEFLFTFALAGASWVVAESIPRQRTTGVPEALA